MSGTANSMVDTKPRLRDALERMRPRLMALDKTRLLQVNIDPFGAVATVRGVLPELLRHHAEFLETFRKFDISNLEQLEDFALALLQAETVHRTFTAKPEELVALLSEAFALRERLVTDARSLADRGLVLRSRLATLNVPNGYRTIGADLLSLSTLLRDSWQSVAGNTPITPAELDRAEVLAEQLLYAMASRRRRTIAAAKAADERQRAFTLMLNAYGEVRQAIIYLRWHAGDADRIAPSLYRKRRGARASVAAVSPVEENAEHAPKTIETSVLGSEAERQLPEAAWVTNKVTDPFVH